MKPRKGGEEPPNPAAAAEWKVESRENEIAVYIGESKPILFDRLPGRIVLFQQLVDAHNRILSGGEQPKVECVEASGKANKATHLTPTQNPLAAAEWTVQEARYDDIRGWLYLYGLFNGDTRLITGDRDELQIVADAHNKVVKELCKQ